MKFGIRLCCVAVLLLLVQAAAAAPPTPRETVTCDGEKLIFKIWSFLAGSPRPDSVNKIPGARITRFEAGDGRTLKGVHLSAAIPQPRGWVLAIQGNAWLAQDLSPYLTPIRDAGFDVYVYDFRGYGMSKPGRRRMAAIVEDYREIAAHLADQHDQPGFLYGSSFGGIVLLNALDGFESFGRVVLDAVPADLDGFDCETDYRPLANLPGACENLLAITGGEDKVVPLPRSQPLLEAVESCGGHKRVREGLGHPFQNEDDAVRFERARELASIFVEALEGRNP